jgi:hypothetical protein
MIPEHLPQGVVNARNDHFDNPVEAPRIIPKPFTSLSSLLTETLTSGQGESLLSSSSHH